jgi:hypothetical protein
MLCVLGPIVDMRILLSVMMVPFSTAALTPKRVAVFFKRFHGIRCLVVYHPLFPNSAIMSVAESFSVL